MLVTACFVLIVGARFRAIWHANWWLRSPNNANSNGNANAWYVNDNGNVNNNNVNNTNPGVRPDIP